MKTSPLAPKTIPALPAIPGVALASCEAGIRYQGRRDLLLVRLAPGTVVAGTLTRSKTRSAAVDWCAKALKTAQASALVVNSGNANAFTGMKGLEAVQVTATEAARVTHSHEDNIFIASTGVIGEPLDPAIFKTFLEKLAAEAVTDAGPEDWQQAAETIMTTDTYPKLASRTLEIAGQTVTLNGIAKGSGMIAPDMATMLAFVFTDAKVEAGILQVMCSRCVSQSFNSITVDSDTSTSDTVLVFATGQSAGLQSPDDRDMFEAALMDLMLDLALQIVRDGEGASKLVKIVVSGAASDEAAKNIALSIGNSPLVKTAIAGEDPNWGRVVMAVGKSGEEADRDRLSIRFGDILVAQKGEIAPSYREEEGARYMQHDELEIHVDLGIGPGTSRIWTCDLTKEYISINADYRS